MASEANRKATNQGYYHRWTLERNEAVQIDLREVETVSWGDSPIVVTATTPAATTASFSYCLDATDDSYDDLTPTNNFWRDVIDSSGAQQTVAAGQTGTAVFDDPVNGIRCNHASGNGDVVVEIFSPVDIDGYVAGVD